MAGETGAGGDRAANVLAEGEVEAGTAVALAAFSLAPPDTDVLAVEFKINLLAPARDTEFLACGRVLRAGRTLTVCLADVLAIDGAKRTAIATMLSTIIVRPKPPR